MISENLKKYLSLAIWELLFSGIYMAYESTLQNTDQNDVVSKVYIVELIINVMLLVVLVKIFQMGIVGVAWSMILTKAIKLFYIFPQYKMGYQICFANLKRSILLLLKVSIPILIETFLWNACSTMIMGTVGHLFLNDITIYSIFSSSLYVLIVPIEAFTKLVKIYTGQLFGKESPHYIKKQVGVLICINQIVIAAVLFATAAYYLNISFFYSNFSDAMFEETYKIIPLILLYTIIKGENEIISNGVLQTGLDNIFKCICEGIIVAGTYGILLWASKETLSFIFGILIVIEGIRLLVVSLRVRTNKWLNFL